MITCQKCRALLEPGTRECPYCQTDQRRHLAPTEAQDAEKTTGFGLWMLGIIVGVYFLTVSFDPARDDPDSQRFQPSGVSLDMFGAADHYLVTVCGQTWRLFTTTFLHADLRHLFFNVIGLFLLIPIAAGAFGVHRTVCLYFASALCGAALSHASGASGVGASGALCGLIGACAVYGRRRGGAFGEDLMRRMLWWAGIIGVYGILFYRQRIDNMGHLGGFLGGAALGYLASAVRARGGRADRAWALAARATVGGAVVVAAVFWAPFVLGIFERPDIISYRSDADRALRAVGSALRTSDVTALPEQFPDGPRGSETVRDRIREALSLARARDPSASAALSRAHDAVADWDASLLCTHCLQ